MARALLGAEEKRRTRKERRKEEEKRREEEREAKRREKKRGEEQRGSAQSRAERRREERRGEAMRGEYYNLARESVRPLKINLITVAAEGPGGSWNESIDERSPGLEAT